MDYIAEKWESYKKTIPGNLTESQIIESKLGFYSGAYALFTDMMGKAMNSGISDDEGSAYLVELEQEFEKFMKNIRNRSFFTS